MKTTQPDHTHFRELLYLEPDGELNAGERSSLVQHLSSCASCREERDELRRMQAMLAQSRARVSDSFTEDVVAGLPAAGWETRSPRTWIAALIAVVLLGFGSALLIGSAADGVLDAAPLAAATAVWELLSSSALAGAGLLGASWKGLGVAFQDILGRSIWNLLALGALVVCLDVMLFRLLFRRRRAETESVDRDGRSS
jgi:predicted anti-sigma-YlaC factor YlaD